LKQRHRVTPNGPLDNKKQDYNVHTCQKVKSVSGQLAQTAKVHPSLCSIKQLQVLLLRFGCNTSPLQGVMLYACTCILFYNNFNRASLTEFSVKKCP